MATKHVSQVTKPAIEQDEERRRAKRGRRKRSTDTTSNSQQRHVGAVAAARERRYVATLAAADPTLADLNDLAAEVAVAYIETWTLGHEDTEAQVWAAYRQHERPNAVTKGVRVAQAAIAQAFAKATSSKKAQPASASA